MRDLIRLVTLTLLVAGVSASVPCGCASSKKARDNGDHRAPPQPPAPATSLSPFFMRQTIHAEVDGDEHQIDAVVQYDDGVVTTVFLNPVGKPAVMLRQHGRDVEVSGPAVDRVPFDLRWVAHDVGLALLVNPWEIEGRDGRRVQQLDAGRITDTWESDHLTRRVAEELKTTIQYSWSPESSCPETIRIDNREFGYRLRIETTQCRTE